MRYTQVLFLSTWFFSVVWGCKARQQTVVASDFSNDYPELDLDQYLNCQSEFWQHQTIGEFALARRELGSNVAADLLLHSLSCRMDLLRHQDAERALLAYLEDRRGVLADLPSVIAYENLLTLRVSPPHRASTLMLSPSSVNPLSDGLQGKIDFNPDFEQRIEKLRKFFDEFEQKTGIINDGGHATTICECACAELGTRRWFDNADVFFVDQISQNGCRHAEEDLNAPRSVHGRQSLDSEPAPVSIYEALDPLAVAEKDDPQGSDRLHAVSGSTCSGTFIIDDDPRKNLRQPGTYVCKWAGHDMRKKSFNSILDALVRVDPRSVKSMRMIELLESHDSKVNYELLRPKFRELFRTIEAN